jgi:UDP-N-acetylmuramate--alanine ligase
MIRIMIVDFSGTRRVHCIGIGGIGVSAIARMLVKDGKRVTGSDIGPSPVTDALKKEGIRTIFGHRASNVPRGTDLVIYTKAVGRDNPELVRAKKLGIPCLAYAEALGEISRRKFTIAISGAHGKTTTTAMVGKLLRDAKLDPTIIVGGVMADSGSNFVGGKGRYLVAEACEYKKSFLDIHPRLIVITNIDNDHLDYYKNLKNIEKAFSKFVSKLGKDEWLVCDPTPKNMQSVVRGAACRILDYTTMPRPTRLLVFGEHNIRDAQAALAVAKVLGIPPGVARRSLASFHGVGRRFEFKGAVRGVRFYDDYAHHPTEIRATLRAARAHFGRRRRLWVVFQPHLYSRTRLLMNDFARSFDDADHVLLADIYAAREKSDTRVHARDLAEKIAKRTGATYLGSFENIAGFLMKNARRGDVVVTMGAGEAYKVFDIFRRA